MKKKSIAVVLVAAMAFGNMHLVFAEDFEGREDEMNKKCSAVSDTATLNECKRYKEYLQNRSNNLETQISDIKNQVSAVQGDVDKIQKVINENTKTLQTYDGQIESIQVNINKVQNNIASMNDEIKSKQEEIKERDQLVKDRMLEMQTYVGSNSYIDFIMGSTSFSDMIRRGKIVAELNNYEDDQIKTLYVEKKEIDTEKKIVQQQIGFLETQQQEVKDKKEVAQALYDSNKTLEEKYQSQRADLDAQQIAAEMESESIKASLPTISTTIPENMGGSGSSSNEENKEEPQAPSEPTTPEDGNSGNSGEEDQEENIDQGQDNEDVDSGNDGGETDNGGNSGGNTSGLSTFLQRPLASGQWYYNYGTWAYPGGGVHVGMDFSTWSNTRLSVVAPATGIILCISSGCPEYGGLGNHCGIAWGGNSVLMAVTLANGESYVLPFFHLYAPTVSPGQIVTQGQQIGLSGSSGNSSGPHLHTEVIYMGHQSLQQIVDTWNANKQYNFGLSWFAPDECGNAPCRLRPENFYL